jgi:hypothetical protein
MASVLIVVALVISQLVLQVSRGPEQRVIQQLSPNTTDQSFYKMDETSAHVVLI